MFPVLGKTTLVSRVIERVRSEKDILGGSLAYFYFKHSRAGVVNKSAMEHMLRAFLDQLLEQDDGLLEHIQKSCDSVHRPDDFREPLLKSLVQDCVVLQHRCWIVVDCLDECDSGRHIDECESSLVLSWFLDEILRTYKAGNLSSVRLLVAGQSDGDIDKQLIGQPTINLDSAKSHLCDLKTYVTAMAAKIRDQFEIPDSRANEITEKVTLTANGTFEILI